MELRKIYISDIGKIITGKTPRTSIADNYGGNIPFLTPSDDLTRKHVVKTGKTLSAKGLNEVKNCLIPEKSICVSCIGSDLGKVVMTSAPTVTNQQINSIVVKDEFDPDFIYYLMKIVGRELNFISKTSTAVPIINKSTFSNTEVFVPSLENQNRIGRILSSLDEKIENNRRINDNLEQQAQALYKSWFVDFEPFCGGEFIESSLGSIPVGWKVGQLSDICEIVGGGTPSKSHPEYYCKRGIAWITPKDLSVSKSKFSSRGSEDITSDGYKNSSAKLMPRGTVLFSSRAPIGYISIATNRICTNQGFKSAVPGTAGTGYLYYFLQANTDKIESKASGSTFKEASGSLMKSLEVIIPADGIFNQFEAELAPILNKQENIASEIQTLTTLRDTLLPKLMSGELKINEIDC